MSSLARAAVAGDERALDLFSSWRPKTGRRGVTQDQARENLNFFLGSMSGVIYYLNENGSCMEVGAAAYKLELQTNVHPKVCNHGEGLYWPNFTSTYSGVNVCLA